MISPWSAEIQEAAVSVIGDKMMNQIGDGSGGFAYNGGNPLQGRSD